ncbi:LacI family DNA-binding transcriptional regulator [Demequina lignilytica]|uniref:LacI family DNA-binding transcriptional regulator n=1 Tax=Demequina lignilytica TaxID=3051663 RepID=A0AB35MI98_9MICO|nr:LacI family DNA-binding transcriptional regulator [Demequina sp. SYSU T0a273]MDN4483408.1 LacI family DNA-binding transcriptional regulator [Demequina sp. SYSU T0a273]
MSTSQAPKRRITQRQIAERAGVSQATVSLVVNGKAEALSRIPASTRDRVLAVIREAEYVADPVARSLAGHGNHLIGIFTYEPAFPTASMDFYATLLSGIEGAAESLGYDLLLFTSAPVKEGKRSVFHPYSRIRLADGCLLLGREIASEELERMVETDFPFVVVGRRDTPGIPYVAVDYVTGTATLVEQAWEAGHRGFALLAVASEGESTRDRREGFTSALAGHGVEGDVLAVDPDDIASAWRWLRATEATVAFVESPADALGLHRQAAKEGIAVPDDLSIVVLADPSRAREEDPDFTRLSPPRERLGAEALALLSRILDPEVEVPVEAQRLTLACEITPGKTLAAPHAQPDQNGVSPS